MGGISVVVTDTKPSAHGYHCTRASGTVSCAGNDNDADADADADDFDNEELDCRVVLENSTKEHFHFVAHVDAPSRLRANVLSGAICWISGPVGTLKLKAEE